MTRRARVAERQWLPARGVETAWPSRCDSISFRLLPPGSLFSPLAVDGAARKPVIAGSFVSCVQAGHHTACVYVVAAFCSLALGLMASDFIGSSVSHPRIIRPAFAQPAACG
ncbi:hypothetical protein WS67_06720 [Burkholderia singularis]|uniref:Uncharacterized protein n=1 Tax=Burkholderia singularis TaxID=1503053 RepID=A0A103E527_9BURK|nr:hypothetical protein [Burkholderia singularis]KVE28443.1 hypothetical protein WS67_06720 [Burkholderia singularis]